MIGLTRFGWISDKAGDKPAPTVWDGEWRRSVLKQRWLLWLWWPKELSKPFKLPAATLNFQNQWPEELPYYAFDESGARDRWMVAALPSVGGRLLPPEPDALGQWYLIGRTDDGEEKEICLFEWSPYAPKAKS